MKKLVLGFACIATVVSLGIVQPAAAATRAPMIPYCPRTITNADNGKTIKMVKGSCATLQLDQDLVWKTPESSSDAVTVFDTETFAPDQAWGLRAVHRGDATITSTGRPKCAPGEVCPLFVRLFSVNIRVNPRPGSAMRRIGYGAMQLAGPGVLRQEDDRTHIRSSTRPRAPRSPARSSSVRRQPASGSPANATSAGADGTK
jgi:predicted secreted protein